MEQKPRKAWLVAVWPGMGGVAQIAGSYLVRALDARQIGELDPTGFFELESIAVRGGLVQPSRLPRSVLYAWRDPSGDRDLLVMIADRQPTSNVQRYAEALLDLARGHEIERVFTFAAMATPVHPATEPRVFAACTTTDLLAELRRDGVTLLEEGEISGLNGVFVAAAAGRELPAACLLGEFPFFAASAPNPKASLAVLRVFARLSGIAVDMGELLADARKIERSLVQHLEALQRAASAESHGAGDEAVEEQAQARSESGPAPIAPKVLEHIETLFARAKQDRSKALQLKAELDRRGLFRRYEDRFLDLFKQAG